MVTYTERIPNYWTVNTDPRPNDERGGALSLLLPRGNARSLRIDQCQVGVINPGNNLSRLIESSNVATNRGWSYRSP